MLGISATIIILFITIYGMKKLYNLVSALSKATNQNFFKTLYYSCSAYIKSFFYSHKNSSLIIKKDKNVYEVHTEIEGKKCIFFVKMNRGPKQPVTAYNDSNHNITSKIHSYLFLDFVVLAPTPKLLGEKHIRINHNCIDTNYTEFEKMMIK